MKKHWPWMIAGGLLLGSMSAWFSIASVELKTARSLAFDLRPPGPFYVPETEPWRLRIWNRTGAPFTAYDASKEKTRYPWRAYKSGEVLFPFVNRVEYVWMDDARQGAGGHVWYLGLFGLSIRLGNSTGWQSGP